MIGIKQSNSNAAFGITTFLRTFNLKQYYCMQKTHVPAPAKTPGSPVDYLIHRQQTTTFRSRLNRKYHETDQTR